MAGLSPKAANVVVPFIRDVIAADPFTVGKPLRWELEGLHSARRGDYRVIYAIDLDTVTIVRVDHRSDAYRPL